MGSAPTVYVFSGGCYYWSMTLVLSTIYYLIKIRKRSRIALKIFLRISDNYSLLLSKKSNQNISTAHLRALITLPMKSQGLVSDEFLSVKTILLATLFVGLYLQHVLTDFDQTWSQAPLPWGIYVHLTKMGSGVNWGHRGQKGYFTKKVSTPLGYVVWSCDSCI